MFIGNWYVLHFFTLFGRTFFYFVIDQDNIDLFSNNLRLKWNVYKFFHVQELNTLVITDNDDEVKNAEVEEEPELPIGVSIKGLKKVFKASIL